METHSLKLDIPQPLYERINILQRRKNAQFKRQSEGLNEEEQTLLNQLVAGYDKALVVRAEAIALLAQRGFDVSVLRKPKR
jgi:hypothetical protein